MLLSAGTQTGGGIVLILYLILLVFFVAIPIYVIYRLIKYLNNRK